MAISPKDAVKFKAGQTIFLANYYEKMIDKSIKQGQLSIDIAARLRNEDEHTRKDVLSMLIDRYRRVGWKNANVLNHVDDDSGSGMYGRIIFRLE